MATQISIGAQNGQKPRGGAEAGGGGMVRVALWMARAAASVRQAGVRAVERMRITRAGGTKRRQMRLVESLALGNRRQLLLVVCDNQRYLVGAGADSVGSILAIDPAPVMRDRAVRGPELVRRRGREAALHAGLDVGREAHLRATAEPGLDLWH